MEIERKFLVQEAPTLSEAQRVEIEQGYIAATPGDAEVRLRRRGEQLLLTAKRGAGLVRDEVEIELDRAQFEALWPLTDGRRLSKLRYLLREDDREIELDVYGAELEGLKVAEIEFPSEQQAESYEPADWLGLEVTGDERYGNRALAEHGAPETTV
jgi:adenylate cyclase